MSRIYTAPRNYPTVLPIRRPLAVPGPRFGNHKCLSLNGSGYASHAHTDLLDMGVGDAMLETWFKWGALSPTTMGVLMSKYKAVDPVTGNGYIVAVDRVTGGIIYFYGDGTNRVTGVLGSGYNDATWHHILLVIDYGNILQVLVDGIQAGSDVDISSVTGTVAPARIFRLGTWTTNYFSGRQSLCAFWYIGYGGLPVTADATPADYARWRKENPYRPLSAFPGDWSGYADADRGEVLNEGDFATHAKWDRTNDIDDTGGNAHYTWSANQTSTLTQTAVNRAKAGDNSHYYELSYTVAVTTAPDGDFALMLTTGFANESTALPFIAGTHRVVFQSAAGAATGAFVIQAVSGDDTEGEFTIDDILLMETGVVGSWPMNGNYNDEDEDGNAGPNALHLTAGGSGNRFVYMDD